MSSSAASIKPRSHATVSGDVLTVVGDIDDNTRLIDLADQIRGNAVIDLSGVTFINSVGVREWITLLDALATRGTEVVLRKISEPMVRQMTMVLEARGEAGVESFFAPYVCTKCGDERSLLLAVEPHRAALADGKPPPQPCAECSAQMDFDEFPNRYLAFLG